MYKYLGDPNTSDFFLCQSTKAIGEQTSTIFVFAIIFDYTDKERTSCSVGVRWIAIAFIVDVQAGVDRVFASRKRLLKKMKDEQVDLILCPATVGPIYIEN